MKDFDKWNFIKKDIDTNRNIDIVFFKEREIWWGNIGINVGSEQNGKGVNFERPILVIKKLSRSTFLGAPLSTKNKNNEFHIEVETKIKGYVLIDQMKTFDIRRLDRKIWDLNESSFNKIRQKIKEIL